MTDFRRGGFGSPSLTGPFQTGGGNFGQYSIGGQDSGADIAYLDKLRAQTAWANGQLTDEAYLAALRKYVNSTDADSSSRVSAENELEDATWSIGRNRIVRDINNSTTPAARVRHLLNLASYDRKRLATMQKGNEQYREQQDRIESTLAEVRAARWNSVYDKYEKGQMTTEQILREAKKYAAASRGKRDHDSYANLVRQYDDRLLSENVADATDAWSQDPTAGNAKAADALLADLVSRAKPGTPDHKAAVKARESFAQNVDAHKKQLELTRMQSKRDNGAISDRDWLDFLRMRYEDEKPGTPERIRARDAFLQAGAAFTQNSIVAGINDGSRTHGDLIDFLGSQLFFMDPGSQQYTDIQSQIAELQAQAQSYAPGISIAQNGSFTSGAYSGSGGYGHMVYPADLAPGGTPVNSRGFASQFDGSAFASTNCGMASAAMLVWAVSGGEVQVSGGDMRYYSGDREGGTWTDDVVRAAGGVGVDAKAYHGMAYSDFKRKVKNGKPAVLTGTSGMLPTELRHGYTGAHSVYVDRVKEHNGETWYFVMDPLGRAGYKGQWWTEEALYAFSWKGTAQGTQGSAVFAGKSGNARSKMGKDKAPPPQSFDTDWKGEGTQGRGGGTSREEAGPQQDWSEGNPTSRPRNEQLTGATPEAVAAFLKAVTKVEQRSLVSGDTAGAQPSDADISFREDRARDLLDANGGDPRLASVEWFTGVRPAADVSSWTKTERWYANIVAKPMGLDKVKKGDIIQPDAPPAAIAGATAPRIPGAGTPGTSGTDRQGAAPLGINSTTEDIARELLARLGIPATAGAVQMVSAMVIAENGNKEVVGNNPLNLKTQGVTQLPGQTGKLDTGTANFESLEAGLDAAADVLEGTEAGQALVAALRGGSPEAFTQAIADSGWSESPEFGNEVTRAFNTLPNTERIISSTMPQYLTAPVGLASASRNTPDLAELLDVDYGDPNQKAWFTENMDRAEAAALGGQPTWTYEAPDGTTYPVPAGGNVVRDVLYLNFEYEVNTALQSPDGAEAITKAKQRLDASTGEIDFTSTERYIDAAMKQRDAAVMRGEWSMAWELEKNVARQVNVFLGNGADATPDITHHNNQWLAGDAQATRYIKDIINRIEPRSTSATGNDQWNPSGSVVGEMVRDGLLDVVQNPDGGPSVLIPKPDQMFVTYDRDGAVEVHNKILDPDEFEPVKVWTPGADGQGDTVMVPAYAAPQSGWQQVTFSNGMSAYVKPEELKTGLFEYYNREYEEPSKTLKQMSLRAPENAPASLTFLTGLMNQSGQVVEVQDREPAVRPDEMDALLVRAGEFVPGASGHPPIQTFSVPDPTTGQTLTGWSLDGGEWMFQIGDTAGSPPALVIKPGSKGKFELQDDGTYALTVDGKVPETIDWAQQVTFYGDDRYDNTRAPSDIASVGGKGQRMVIKPGVPSQDGRAPVIDATFSPLQMLRAGAISPAQAQAMAMTERKATEEWLNEGGQAQINAQYAAAKAAAEEAGAISTETDWVNKALNISPVEQLSGPNAMTGYADPQVANGVAANATAGAVFLAEEDMRAAQAAKAAEVAAAEAARAANAVQGPTPMAPKTVTANPAEGPVPTWSGKAQVSTKAEPTPVAVKKPTVKDPDQQKIMGSGTQIR